MATPPPRLSSRLGLGGHDNRPCLTLPWRRPEEVNAMAALSPAQKDIPVADRWREDPFGAHMPMRTAPGHQARTLATATGTIRWPPSSRHPWLADPARATSERAAWLRADVPAPATRMLPR